MRFLCVGGVGSVKKHDQQGQITLFTKGNVSTIPRTLFWLRSLTNRDLYPVSFPKVKRFFEFTRKRGKNLHNNYNKKWYSAPPLFFCSITFFHKINNKENLFISPCNFSSFFLLRNLLFPLPLRRKNYMVLWTKNL